MSSFQETRDGLARQLDYDLSRLRKFDKYYRGAQPLAFLSPDARELSQGRLQNVSVNWSRLVVDSLEERLDVEGFRSSANLSGDQALWSLWQSNSMDERSQQAHMDALIYGRSFVLVWVDSIGRPRISVESPLQMTVEIDPGSGEVVSALKRWRNAAGYGRALLFTQDKLVHFKSRTPSPAPINTQPIDALANSMDTGIGDWDQFLVEDNPLGVVPVVPFVNRPRLMLPLGESELVDVMPLVDALNKLATDMMVSAEFHAQPRRWATGILQGNMAPSSQQGSDVRSQMEQYWEGAKKSKVWLAAGPDAKFGQFPEAMLDNFIGAIRLLTTQVAAVAGLPPHYLGLVSDNAASADAIRSAEASLVKKAYRRQRIWGERWEDVMRLAVHVRDGVAPTMLDGIETIWKSPETRTVAQAADAATKLFGANIIDQRTALEELDYTPQVIDRITNPQMIGIM